MQHPVAFVCFAQAVVITVVKKNIPGKLLIVVPNLKITVKFIPGSNFIWLERRERKTDKFFFEN
ncbi:hypothetical protein GCM10011518_25070 [Flavobacterium limi]|uniref:Uncharacterized protein n=1 Tax=Flavobacterium limi TaxID=2045105 RepID=A0ABQ1UBA6_9FLAO|nr:hypothetical protein GCM10011518_25070 [Flavobacterium limi]